MSGYNPMVARCWGQLDEALKRAEPDSARDLRRMVSEHLEGNRLETLRPDRSFILATRVTGAMRRESFIFSFGSPADANHFYRCFHDLCVVARVPAPAEAA